MKYDDLTEDELRLIAAELLQQLPPDVAEELLASV